MKPGAFNTLAAQRLREAGTLLALQDDSPFRAAAYRNAADAVASYPADLAELYRQGGVATLQEIEAIGPKVAAALAELAQTGRWTYLERLRGAGEAPDIFCIIPGIGPALAKRLHETLHVETLEQLEAVLNEKSANAITGIGPRRLAMLRSGLNQMLQRIRPLRTPPGEEPSVEDLLDVDRLYRSGAEANALKKIAPRRFNPKGEAWLPILHARRGKWHYTALYSNTARAHELDKVKDWVVIYFHSDGGGEAQRTVVTETHGALSGRRVVRGRERECLDISAAQTPDLIAPRVGQPSLHA